MSFDRAFYPHRAIRGRVSSILLAFMTALAGTDALAAGLFSPTGVGATVASGDQITLYGISTYWDGVCACAPLTDRGLGVRVYAQVAYWEGNQHPSDFRSLWEGSITPALLWMGPSVGAGNIFTDLGVGISLISETRINQDRQFATAFQFNEHFGVGYAFGENHRYEVA